MQVKTLRTYMIMAQILVLFLLLSLIVLNVFPLTTGNDDLVVMQQANFQLARAEFIAKDVLILAYRPITNRSQAINELQTILPQYQQVQTGLLKGDIVLGLPPNPSDNVRVALLATQSDYIAISVAVNHLIAQPDDTPDMIQINIVSQHERAYVSEMYQVITLLQQGAEARKVQLVTIKIVIIVLAGTVVVLKYTLFTTRVIKKMMETEEDRFS